MKNLLNKQFCGERGGECKHCKKDCKSVRTVKDIFDSMSDEQRVAVRILVDQAVLDAKNA